MESKVNFAAVGAFVVVLTVAMVAGTLWLVSGKYERRAVETYETYLTESVSGLNPNAPVRYHGVEVGRVRTIMLSPGNVEEVRLVLDIDRGTPVKTDTVATLRTQGLTGIAFVELSAGTRESPPLRAAAGRDPPVIRSAPSLIGHLETETPVLLANLARVSANLDALLDAPNRHAIATTLADLAAVTHALAARTATLDATLADTSRTMRAAAATGAALPDAVRRIDRAAGALERMADAVGDAGRQVRSTVDAVRPAVDASRDTVADLGATLPDVRELLGDLREATATLRRAGETVEHDPGLLLQRPRPPRRGPGE